ncbi:acetylornithine transaminase [Metabacillus fastidiosus]|uniref:Acetylornithine aminotransferase n=1 Tax=Metabacillus fastidiosus TaxID=1458 RepID=A0ABU6P1D6_9BACI|nr:acetylornithine transaminase [Metabacillus fastidiosus]MED4403167.1 acetylornithine transaminase [Metabacillus fastidiosus]MED4461592.1 acetylornithine transaminase [Metabacillus fastidiosus]
MSYLFPTYARWNFTVKEAEGAWLIDENDDKYLDFISGIAVCNLGHVDEDVKNAVEEQLQKVWHTSNLFKVPLQEEVAKRLVENSDGDAVFFCNSGAEANEAAIKLARKHTGKSKIVTFKQSFHGRTFATMSATGQEKIQIGFGPLLQTFEYLPYNDTAALEQLEGEEVAAIMLEVVQGEGGVIPAHKDFLQKVAETCKKLNALLIIDEIQTGIGRTGKPFGYQHYGISPDIITSAKGLGNGIPVGAMIGKKELIESFQPGSHGSTFGGNFIAMASANATLKKIMDPSFLQAVEEKGKSLVQKLEDALYGHELVKEIRGKGLLIGIECSEQVTDLINTARENKLLVLPAGPNVIRLLPPLNVTEEEMDTAVAILKETFSTYKK